jgi:hypothetical protein
VATRTGKGEQESKKKSRRVKTMVPRFLVLEYRGIGVES